MCKSMNKSFGYLNKNEEHAVKKFVSLIKEKLKDQVIEIKLFGSKVRGNYYEDSDIDILMILKERKKVVIDTLYQELLEVELEYDSKISLTIFSEGEYNHNIHARTPFVQTLANEGVRL